MGEGENKEVKEQEELVEEGQQGTGKSVVGSEQTIFVAWLGFILGTNTATPKVRGHHHLAFETVFAASSLASC